MSSGFVVYRASRLEALLTPLTALLHTFPPEDALAPQTVIAAHPGMKQWLLGALARQRGELGIAANLDIVLPSAWLDRLAREVLGESAVALREYRREHLRWRIHGLLDELDDAQIASYLQGHDVARRRFQLADRLARIFTQYLVYRPDWLQAWRDGRTPPRDAALDAGLLAPLWQKLRAQIGLPHRGELLAQLVARLGKYGTTASEPLHVFGVAHLAPAELDVLRAVAGHRMVVLYVPDPCREYWAGMRDERSRLRELVKQAADAPQTESVFLDQGHPLLGSWGRMGQHFMLALEDSETLVDERHWQDLETALVPRTRLEGVQESIRQARPALMAPRGDSAAERADRTLRVHACHTRLRELEVLRDALLRELIEDRTLRPAEIVVMAPDIQAYVPLLSAVFGEAGRHEGPLPYHLADVAVSSAHSLFEAFRRLLELPQSRFTAPEVLDLLAVPAISARLGLKNGDIDVISGWLQNSRVAWALDADFRTRFEVPSIAEHTFAWGMDRMLAGYVMGQPGAPDVTAVQLPDGSELAPLEGIHGPQAALLGALDRLLLELAGWCVDTSRVHRASEWAVLLERHFEALFFIDFTDQGARDAATQLLRFIRAIASEPGDAGLDPALEFGVVRDLLLARLTAVPERQRFLMGGVTFCGMVPQRAIPFRVVAALGLNDGEFPRAVSDGGLDLMNRHRRLGDRDVRSDDRYLFLETVMSARNVLHLSYLGEGVRDGKPRNPAAPLAELMTALDDAADVLPDADDMSEDGQGVRQHRRPWLVRHPLQPFDDHYFDASDAALFSFRRDFAAMTSAGREQQPLAPFLADPAAAGLAPAPVEYDGFIALQEVLAYYKDPAKQLLASGLKLRLDALEVDRLRESEPLAPAFEALDTVARRLFIEAAIRNETVLPEQPPAWLRLTGVQPPGRVGALAWAAERQKVNTLLALAADQPLFRSGLPAASPLSIDRDLDGHHVVGELRRVRDRDDIRWVFDVYPGKKGEATLGFKERIGFFLEWALARLADPAGTQAVRACIVIDGDRADWQDSFNRWDDAFMTAVHADDASARQRMLADLTHRVTKLLGFWLDAQQQPAWYFPATSWAAATDSKIPPMAATRKWMSLHDATGERDYSPGYARLLAGERDFSPEHPEYALLEATAAQLWRWITLAAAVGGSA